MPKPPSKGSRWFPTKNQLSSPEDLMSTLRQVLEQHYTLVDQFNAYKKANPPSVATKSSGPPPGSGPLDTQICGLFVAPVDVQTLADGATLKFVKKDGNFQFS